MEQRVGTCSLCGGNVMGVRGAYMSVYPPPPDRCAGCGAIRNDDVIPMRKEPKMGEPGWLTKQLDSAKATVADLPAWLRPGNR